MTPRRILVLRGGAVGDFICTLPALTALRRRWPAAYIELLGTPSIAALALDAGLVDAVRSLDEGRVAPLFAEPPQPGDARRRPAWSFDLAINYLHDPEGTVRTNLLAAGVARVVAGSPLVTVRHAVDQLLLPLRELGIEAPEAARPILSPAETGIAAVRQRLAVRGERIVAIHPGSGSPRKNWMLDRFVEVARRLRAEEGVTPVFITGEAEADVVVRLGALAADVPKVSGWSLPEIARLLTLCAGYLGNDSGITHLAASVGIPVVALFGPSRVDLWGPRGPRVRRVEAPRGDLGRISVDPVWQAMRSALNPGKDTGKV